MNENEYKLQVYVTKDNVTIQNKEKIHTGEYKITKCEFEFTDDYEGLTKKAIFEADDVIKEMPIIANECDIPEEVLQDGYLSCNLRVYGYDIEEVNGEATIKLRYSPTYDEFPIWKGSFIPNAEQGEEITPTQFEQYTAALNEGLEAIEDKIEEADAVLEDIDEAIEATNNLDLDVSKEGKVATVTLTKKDATTKVVTLSDGTSLMFNWDGTKLGIKTDEDEEYTYVDLQGIQGETGPMGAPFTIKKTYSSVAEMNADFDNMEVGDYVMITSSVEVQDNAKLYTRGEEAWIFITDFSGATGIQGPIGATPNIQIGTVTSGNAPSVTRTGTNENPVLNFVLEQGEQGVQGETGATGNGIASITKTGTSGSVDTYTITFTNGNTTTFEVTNGEVSQAQLDETNRMVDQALSVYNALPKVTGNGEMITLNNTAETPLKLTLKGNAYQYSTTGANLQKYNARTSGIYNCDSNGQITIVGTPTSATTYAINQSGNEMSLEAGTYIVKFVGNLGGIVTATININGSTNNKTINDNQEVSFTLTATSNVRVLVPVGIDITYNSNFYVTCAKDTATTERYTGGIPSPNPNYPQDIEVVTGYNKLTISNVNLCNGVAYNKGANANGNLTNGATYLGIYNYIKVKPNTQYAIKFENDIASAKLYVSERDINNNFITRGNVSTARTFTTGANTYYVFPYLYDTGTTSFTANGYVMLIEGSTPTNFISHQEQNYEINLGKNLLPFTNQDFTKNSFRFYVQNGELYFNGTPSSNITSADSVYKDNFAFILPKGTYYFNRGNVLTNVVTTVARIFKYSDDTTLKENLGEFTLTEDTKVYLGFYLPTSKTFSNTKIDIQLEKGTQATSYAPYFTPIELCKIVDYQDYITKSTGKNLFDKGTATTLNISIQANNLTTSSSSNARTTYMEIQPNTTYTISKIASQRFVVATSKVTPASSISLLQAITDNTGTNITITTDSEAKYLLIYFFLSTADTKTQQEIYNTIQVEYGNQATDYEPYGVGNWYKKAYIGKIVLDGTENWTASSALNTTDYYAYYVANSSLAMPSESVVGVMSNYFIGDKRANRTANKSNCWLNNSVSQFFVHSPETTASNFQTWLGTHNTTVYYLLKTPTGELITEPTLIQQLNDLYYAKSYNEQTNVNQDNANRAFLMNAETVRDLSNIFNG